MSNDYFKSLNKIKNMGFNSVYSGIFFRDKEQEKDGIKTYYDLLENPQTGAIIQMESYNFYVDRPPVVNKIACAYNLLMDDGKFGQNLFLGSGGSMVGYGDGRWVRVGIIDDDSVWNVEHVLDDVKSHGKFLKDWVNKPFLFVPEFINKGDTAEDKHKNFVSFFNSIPDTIKKKLTIPSEYEVKKDINVDLAVLPSKWTDLVFHNEKIGKNSNVPEIDRFFLKHLHSFIISPRKDLSADDFKKDKLFHITENGLNIFSVLPYVSDHDTIKSILTVIKNDFSLDESLERINHPDNFGITPFLNLLKTQAAAMPNKKLLKNDFLKDWFLKKFGENLILDSGKNSFLSIFTQCGRPKDEDGYVIDLLKSFDSYAVNWKTKLYVYADPLNDLQYECKEVLSSLEDVKDFVLNKTRVSDSFANKFDAMWTKGVLENSIKEVGNKTNTFKV